MRVAHIITRMIVGGAQENTLFNCLDLIRDFGDDVLLITGPSEGPEGDLLVEHERNVSAGKAPPLQIIRVDSLRRAIHPWWDVRAAVDLRRVLKTFRPDVVHTHSAKGGLVGRGVAWSMRVPVVVHSVHGAPFHDFQNPISRWFFQRCERWAAKRCHHMICVAEAMTDLMVDAGVAPREKFTKVLSGMDVEPFVHADQHRERVRSRLGLKPEDVVVGKIARLFHLKGHDDLVAAAAEVIAHNRNVRFLCVGDGILREPLAAEIERLGLTEHFIFTGLVPPSEVPSLIGAMDLLVHTSLREGLARALPQALIAGRPVISYDIDGAKEVTIDGETGYLVPPRDRKRLAEAMVSLAGDADRRRRMGEQGRARFTEPFRHQTMTRKIREIYEAVADGEL